MEDLIQDLNTINYIKSALIVAYMIAYTRH